MFRQITTLVKKDLLLELRQQHTLFGVILYVAATIYVLYLALGGDPDATTWNSLFWVFMLFICVNSVAKSFLQESRGRMLYFYSIASPVAFILAKLIYNLLLMLLMVLISLALYIFFLGNPTLHTAYFFAIAVFGGLSISMVFTLMSAIAAKANQNAALMAILGFPIILPLLMLVMRLNKRALGEVFEQGAVTQLTLIITGFDVLIIALAVILFPYIWKD